MEKIRALTKRLSYQKVTRLRVLGNPLTTNEPQESRAHIIYQAILDGEVVDDKTCAALLGWDVNSRYYVRFKRNFYFKLTDMLMFLDPKSEHVRADTLYLSTIYNKINKILYLYEIGEKKIAINRAIELWKKVKKDHYLSVDLILSNLLKNYYLYEKPDKIKYRKYKKEYRLYRQAYIANVFAQYYLKLLDLYITNVYLVRGDRDVRFEEMHEKLKLKFSQVPLKPYFWKSYYNAELKILYKIYTKEKLIEYAKQRLFEFEKLKSKSLEKDIFSFRETLFICHLEDDNYEEASFYLKEIKKSNKTISLQLRILFFEMHYYLVRGDYKSCLATFLKYQRMESSSKSFYFEHVEIIRAWLHLLFLNGHFEGMDTEKISKFNIYGFKNNILKYSKDKEGTNAQLFIIECCYLLLKNKKEKLYDKSGSLAKYTLRYFSGKQSRTGTMLKLMVLVSKNIFQTAKISNKIDVLLDELQEYKSDKMKEIILYEKMRYEDVFKQFVFSFLE